MDTQSAIKLTIIFIVGIVLIVAAYDVWVFVKYGGEATISRILYRAAQDSPIITLAIGVLLGHLFWAQKIEVKPEEKPETEKL